ncbi:MAG: sel1 repeat family protein [Nitrosomonadales bacterium]|nr:sel1 repeat family protein [Nitrosomonadales bacterium]
MLKLLFLLCALLWPGLVSAEIGNALETYRKGDFKAAAAEIQNLARQGNAEAQADLGEMYEEGLGVQQDYVQAVEWFRKSAAQGNADAQSNLGMMYFNGRGIPQDYAQAAEWFRKSSAHSPAGASDGKDPSAPQHNEKLEWYRKNVERGVVNAQLILGTMYESGLGIPQDYVQAVEWYRKAAAQGNVDAQILLGVKYEKGLGVAQDYVQAHMWFNLAAASGDREAIKHRDSLADKMTVSQIVDAQRQLQEWTTRHDGQP